MITLEGITITHSSPRRCDMWLLRPRNTAKHDDLRCNLQQDVGIQDTFESPSAFESWLLQGNNQDSPTNPRTIGPGVTRYAVHVQREGVAVNAAILLQKTTEGRYKATVDDLSATYTTARTR